MTGRFWTRQIRTQAQPREKVEAWDEVQIEEHFETDIKRVDAYDLMFTGPFLKAIPTNFNTAFESLGKNMAAKQDVRNTKFAYMNEDAL